MDIDKKTMQDDIKSNNDFLEQDMGNAYTSDADNTLSNDLEPTPINSDSFTNIEQNLEDAETKSEIKDKADVNSSLQVNAMDMSELISKINVINGELLEISKAVSEVQTNVSSLTAIPF